VQDPTIRIDFSSAESISPADFSAIPALSSLLCRTPDIGARAVTALLGRSCVQGATLRIDFSSAQSTSAAFATTAIPALSLELHGTLEIRARFLRSSDLNGTPRIAISSVQSIVSAVLPPSRLGRTALMLSAFFGTSNSARDSMPAKLSHYLVASPYFVRPGQSPHVTGTPEAVFDLESATTRTPILLPRETNQRTQFPSAFRPGDGAAGKGTSAAAIAGITVGVLLAIAAAAFALLHRRRHEDSQSESEEEHEMPSSQNLGFVEHSTFINAIDWDELGMEGKSLDIFE
jgi:hypothetical protein